jgi:methyl-accepting chemotaxis protein
LFGRTKPIIKSSRDKTMKNTNHKVAPAAAAPAANNSVVLYDDFGFNFLRRTLIGLLVMCGLTIVLIAIAILPNLILSGIILIGIILSGFLGYLVAWLILIKTHRTLIPGWITIIQLCLGTAAISLTIQSSIIPFTLLIAVIISFVSLNNLAAFFCATWAAALQIILVLMATAAMGATNTPETAAATGNFRVAALSIGFSAAMLIMGITWVLAYVTGKLKEANRLALSQARELSATLADINQKRAVGEEVGQRLFMYSSELSTAAAEQNKGSRQQAVTISELTSFLTELTATAQNIREQTEELARFADSIRQSAAAGKAAATEVAASGDKTSAAVKQVADNSFQVEELYTGLQSNLHELAERQSEIRGIVGVIRGISQETHLLSLNAAIEAAGAGIYGERFGVVAGEVKALANRSINASRSVEAIIGQVEDYIQSAVQIGHAGYRQMQETTEVVRQSLSVMTELVKNISENLAQSERIETFATVMSGQAVEIRYAATQQYTASNQATAGLNEINVIAAQNAVSSDHISRSSQNLEELSQKLLQTMVEGEGEGEGEIEQHQALKFTSV